MKCFVRGWRSGTKTKFETIFTILLELAGRVMEPEENPIATWCIESLGELVDENHNSQAAMAIYKARQGQTSDAVQWFIKAQDSLNQRELNLKALVNHLMVSKSQQNISTQAGTQLKKGEMGIGWYYLTTVCKRQLLAYSVGRDHYQNHSMRLKCQFEW